MDFFLLYIFVLCILFGELEGILGLLDGISVFCVDENFCKCVDKWCFFGISLGSRVVKYVVLRLYGNLVVCGEGIIIVWV